MLNPTTQMLPLNQLLPSLANAMKSPSPGVWVIPLCRLTAMPKRGFRTGRVQQPLGANSDHTREPSPLRSLLDKLFPVLAKSTTSKTAPELEKYNVYKLELNKIPESERKFFTDGFVRGLLASPKEATQVPVAKFRIGRTVIVLCLLYIGYSALTLVGDKKSRFQFIFTSPHEVKPEQVNVNFDDVRGMDEAKCEVEEIVNYLRNPGHYARLGGRLPKGVLLVGPPGTGKTLLARAIAGEAGVPFFHTSGSEFDEVLVGQGARRVRDLFERAKQKAPCIVFIDEIDSVGSKRVSNSLHPYANQTINQLLNEMDGFEQNEGVIVIGATNRIEDLDKALLRPGRFDSQVIVRKPDLAGRIDIFLLYLAKIVHEKLVVTNLARGTTGFTGADIENMVNQAALKAASDGSARVTMRHLEEARDRILMGPARLKGRLPDEETNLATAWHESGHALVAYYTKDAEPLHAVTIIPRGGSLGHTSFLPEKEVYTKTKSQLLAELDVAMGGRVAEELALGSEKITIGAADDLRRATATAVAMVKSFGMCEASGLRDYTVDVDMEREALIKVTDRGQKATETIDTEIERLLQESYRRAKEILTTHHKEHKALVEALMEYETITGEEVRTLANGGSIERPITQAPITLKGGKKRRPRQPIIEIQVD